MVLETLIQEILPVKIENLKSLNYVQMNASSCPECLPDTRQDLLKSIADWQTTPSPDQNIFWLHGQAGSGKSTISTTLAEYFRELGRLSAFMFFDRNNPSNSEPATVVPQACII
jgi:pantothenate kinase-related protein Tda10